MEIFISVDGQPVDWVKMGVFFPNSVRLLDRQNTTKQKQRAPDISPTMNWLNKYRGDSTFTQLISAGEALPDPYKNKRCYNKKKRPLELICLTDTIEAAANLDHHVAKHCRTEPIRKFSLRLVCDLQVFLDEQQTTSNIIVEDITPTKTFDALRCDLSLLGINLKL